jgi:RNA polymerase sigma-70 factor (ECF subfamily)
MAAESAALPPGNVTSTSLLAGLRDPENHAVWRQYVERYRSLIVAYAAKLGVPAEDGEDVAQAALLSFSSAYRDGRYDRAKGRLSSWLFGIATNEVRAWRRRRGERAGAGDRRAGPTESERALAEIESDDALGALWEREWRDAVLWECLSVLRREMRPETVRAFELYALGERPAGDMARELGLTENAVFLSKRRVLARLRELLPLVEDAW